MFIEKTTIQLIHNGGEHWTHALDRCQWFEKAAERSHVVVPATLKRILNGKETEFKMVKNLSIIHVNGA